MAMMHLRLIAKKSKSQRKDYNIFDAQGPVQYFEVQTCTVTGTKSNAPLYLTFSAIHAKSCIILSD